MNNFLCVSIAFFKPYSSHVFTFFAAVDLRAIKDIPNVNNMDQHY
jgi:hypothetical protein